MAEAPASLSRGDRDALVLVVAQEGLSFAEMAACDRTVAAAPSLAEDEGCIGGMSLIKDFRRDIRR